MTHHAEGRRTLTPPQLLEMLKQDSMCRSDIELASRMSRSHVQKTLNALWVTNDIVIDHEDVHSSGAKIPFYRAATEREKTALLAAPTGRTSIGGKRSTIKASPLGQRAIIAPQNIGFVPDPLVASLFGMRI